MKKAAVIIALAFLSSCYYDKENDLYPDEVSDCDTLSVTYVKDVKPVITAHCIKCHSNSSASTLGGGIKLESYSDVKEHTLNGSLYGSVSADPEFYVMPRDYRIPSCTVLKIKVWASNGTPEN